MFSWICHLKERLDVEVALTSVVCSLQVWRHNSWVLWYVKKDRTLKRPRTIWFEALLLGRKDCRIWRMKFSGTAPVLAFGQFGS